MPWVSVSLKNTLNQKRLASHQDDIHQRDAQKVKREIKLLESCCAWRGIKSMVGIQDKKRGV